MTFAHPVVLFLIPVAPVAIWWLFRTKHNAADGAAFPSIHRLWATGHGLSDTPAATGRRLRGVCLAAGTIIALLALARPQWGEIAEQSYERSREVMLALDLSRSMLADDVAPSRLARAKLLIDSLLDQLKGERVGLIVFAGSAFVQSPLSADYEVLRDFLAELDPSYLPQGGTDYESMLKTALQAFGQQGGGDRFLVVLSDGEAHDETWKALLPQLHEHGIHVIGLGVGTPAGALVPAADGGVMKDEQGNAVLSRLEPATLQELASATGGTYRDAAAWVDIAELVDTTVARGNKGDYVEERHVRLQDRFQWFLAPAVLFLLLSLWLDLPVAPIARARQLHGRRSQLAAAPVIAAALTTLAAWHLPCQADAATADVAPPTSVVAPNQAHPANPLADTVADLIAKPALGAADYARLATDTVAFASQPSAPKGAPRAGVIDDALAAVDRGEPLDAKAADWPALRAELERLKQVKDEPPPQQQPQQQEQKKDQQQGQGGDQDQQQQQGQSGGQGQQDQQQAGDGGQQDQQPKADASAGKDQQNAENSDRPGDQAQSADADRPASGRPADAEVRPHKSGTDVGPAAPAEGEPKENQRDSARETARADETKPIAAPEASLSEPEKPQDAPAAQAQAQETQPLEAPQKPASRMVGGGRTVPESESEGDLALAEALGRMEHVKDGDSPAVLFDRMNRAEGRPRTESNGKNW